MSHTVLAYVRLRYTDFHANFQMILYYTIFKIKLLQMKQFEIWWNLIWAFS